MLFRVVILVALACTPSGLNVTMASRGFGCHRAPWGPCHHAQLQASVTLSMSMSVCQESVGRIMVLSMPAVLWSIDAIVLNPSGFKV
jgi:hypothetical protein